MVEADHEIGTCDRGLGGLTKKPTIDDVAARAGVARTTVSRVLNNSPNVRDEVRDKVRAAMEGLGYQVNVQARYLASGSSRQLALVHATDLDVEPNSYYHSGLELGAMRACADLGYVLVTHTANPAKPEDRARIRRLAESGSQNGDPGAHLPPEARGVLGQESERDIAQFKQDLRANLDPEGRCKFGPFG